jgi:hypothetical protein
MKRGFLAGKRTQTVHSSWALSFCGIIKWNLIVFRQLVGPLVRGVGPTYGLSLDRTHEQWNSNMRQCCRWHQVPRHNLESFLHTHKSQEHLTAVLLQRSEELFQRSFVISQVSDAFLLLQGCSINDSIFLCILSSRGPPLWSSGQSSWLQIQESGFDSRRYQIFWDVVGLERGPLSLVSTIEELLERKNYDL